MKLPLTKKSLIILSVISIPLWVMMGLKVKDEFVSHRNISVSKLIMAQRYNLNDMPLKKAEYTLFMIDLLDRYSDYDNEKKDQYITQNWYTANGLSFNIYEQPGVRYLETGFVTTAKHTVGEIGDDGIMPSTGEIAQFIYQYKFPEHLKKYVKIPVKDKLDLTDTVTSMRACYILLWYYRSKHDNMENWYISMYHWGKWLYKGWLNKEFPMRFVINNVKLNPRKYYIAWRSVVTSYNQGRLEPSSLVRRRYKREYKKQCKEEEEFRYIYRTLKKQKVYIAKVVAKNQEYLQAIEDLKRVNKESIRKAKKVSGEAKAGGGKKALRKIKDVAKWFIDKMEGLKK